MKYDRKLTITVGNSRRSMNWVRQQTTVAEFYARMGQVIRGKETVAEYFRMNKTDQDNLKDVAGGYVGGTINGPRRKVKNVTGRSLITLDFDNIPAFGVDNIIAKLDLCGFSYCVYSTRKHTPNAPRLRVLIVTDRDMTIDEYEPVARRVAEYIGIDKADPTTFELHRLFYYPTACADGEFVYKVKDAPFAKVDKLLSSYKDWHDVTEWPQVPGCFNYKKLATRQGDPEEKPGIVGAFCRVYDIYRAMDELIPGVYSPVDNAEDRYTYLNGSTAGGAVVYEHGKFLYSHHATDPCSGKLVNAFDLVRLHKFGDLDDDTDPAITPVNRMPSFKQMCQYANGLDDVAALIIKERMQTAADDFKDLPGVGFDTSLAGANVAQNATTDPGDGATQAAVDAACADPDGGTGSGGQAAGGLADDINWMLKLDRDRNNKILNTMDNILLIMENDPNLKSRFALNEFSGRGEVLAALPWARDYRGRRMWSDTDSNGLYWYLEKVYQINGRGNIDSALDIHASTHSFNDVTNFLDSLKWDGTARLDTLFHDYLGAEDSEYVRAVCRKTFCGAVARAYRPGCKFDTMLILCGPQGIGKSTLIDKMSKGWYNDSIRTFEGKDASELLQGVWLVEVAELDAFRRTDVACIKQFLSLRVDRYRAAYGRNVKEYPRRCIFFGTCNQMEFLQDTTGNRRFWPVDVGVAFSPQTRRSVFKDLTDEVITQVWAEAKIRYQMGEELYLSGDLDAIAQKAQEEHRESAAQEGMIIDFLDRPIPSDWITWPIARRRDYWAGAVKKDDLTLVPRDRVCAIEVWTELFNKNPADVKKVETAMVNAIISRQPDWKRSTVRCGPYGDNPIKGFIRVHKKG